MHNKSTVFFLVLVSGLHLHDFMAQTVAAVWNKDTYQTVFSYECMVVKRTVTLLQRLLKFSLTHSKIKLGSHFILSFLILQLLV